MAAHVLGGLDKQWLWWKMVRHVGSMDNDDQSSTATEQKHSLKHINQVTGIIQRVALDQINYRKQGAKYIRRCRAADQYFQLIHNHLV